MNACTVHLLYFVCLFNQYGHSVGSGPCCDFVAKRKQKGLGGVILHSSIASGNSKHKDCGV